MGEKAPTHIQMIMTVMMTCFSPIVYVIITIRKMKLTGKAVQMRS